MRLPGNLALLAGIRRHSPILAAFLLTSLAASLGCGNPSPALPPGNPPADNPVLLIGNTRDDNVVLFEQKTASYVGEFVKKGSGGLHAPDFILYGPDGNLYVASGDTLLTSAVL